MRRFLSPIESGIAAGMLALGLVFFFIHASNPLASPDKSLKSAVQSASQGSLEDFHRALTDAYFQNLIGHFGELKFRSVRNVYDEAYALARPIWLGYRNKAELVSKSAYGDLHNKVERLGKEAINRLPLDERMQLTGDRQKYAEQVFQEGIKALSEHERQQVGGPEAFRKFANFKTFTDRHAWELRC